jgi:hypothetical protein
VGVDLPPELTGVDPHTASSIFFCLTVLAFQHVYFTYMNYTSLQVQYIHKSFTRCKLSQTANVM